MQRASSAARIYQSVAPLGLKPSDVTSVISGPHVKGSAHFDGRAIDVGSISGAAVGYNKKTWDFVVQAITRGGISALGTIPEIASNPAMQQFAAQHGVRLFVDRGTGSHIHLEGGG